MWQKMSLQRPDFPKAALSGFAFRRVWFREIVRVVVFRTCPVLNVLKPVVYIIDAPASIVKIV